MHTIENLHRDLQIATLRYQSELLAAADLNEETRRKALTESNETGGKISQVQQMAP